jgi:hypothetical protein
MEREKLPGTLGPDKSVLDRSSFGVYTDRQDGNGETLRDIFNKDADIVKAETDEFNSK